MKKVTSIEHKKVWFDQLPQIIRGENITNVDLQFRDQIEQIADFSEVPDASLDLLFVDGGAREQCLRAGFPKVRPGGYVYLDNWDFDQFFGDCRDFITQHADEIESSRSFIDYVPAQVGV